MGEIHGTGQYRTWNPNMRIHSLTHSVMNFWKYSDIGSLVKSPTRSSDGLRLLVGDPVALYCRGLKSRCCGPIFPMQLWSNVHRVGLKMMLAAIWVSSYLPTDLSIHLVIYMYMYTYIYIYASRHILLPPDSRHAGLFAAPKS